MKKRVIGIVLLLVGLFFGISMAKALVVDGPKAKKALNDAVYVGSEGFDSANEGKTVIVCGEFELTEGATDDETGLSFDSICVVKNKQIYKRAKPAENDDTANEYDKKHKLEWSDSGSSTKYIGSGKVGEYELSKEFIENVTTDKIRENYDKQELSELGYAYVSDSSYTQKHFIMPASQAKTGIYGEGDVRYYFNCNDVEDGSTVTVIGIQEGNTLKALEDIPNNIMKGELDKAAVLENYGSESVGGNIFGVVVSLILIIGGAVLIFKK